MSQKEFPLNKDSFEKLFKEYYSMLCIIAYDYVRDKTLAEEMVEDTFLHVWEKRESIVVTPAIKYFLIKSTQNTCLQYLRKRRYNIQSIDNISTEKFITWSSDYPLGQLFEKEILEILNHTVDYFLEQIRKVFILSRYKDMSYSQIADMLNVSENTVKTQIKIALSRLRAALKDYLMLMPWILTSIHIY